MTLETLRQRLHSQSTTVNVSGTDWKIGKLSAAEVFTLGDAAAAPDADKDQSESGRRFYIALLSKCLLNDSGRAFDSDEARDGLAGVLTWHELKALGQAAMEFNGLGDDAKKN